MTVFVSVNTSKQASAELLAVSPVAPMPVLDQKGLPELVRGGGSTDKK
jgi:hypothetical protein